MLDEVCLLKTRSRREIKIVQNREKLASSSISPAPLFLAVAKYAIQTTQIGLSKCADISTKCQNHDMPPGAESRLFWDETTFLPKCVDLILRPVPRLEASASENGCGLHRAGLRNPQAVLSTNTINVLLPASD